MDRLKASADHRRTTAMAPDASTSPLGHTPGPWQGCLHLRENADTTCGCGYRGGIWSTSADVLICEMAAGSAEGADMIPVSSRPMQIADHYLIAAAPDMLSDLAEAERVFRHYGDLHAAKPDPVKATRNYEMADRLAATIAKARGEQA